MQMVSFCFALLAIALPANAEWELLGRAQGETLIELTFAVKQQSLDELERLTIAVSSPDDPLYGQHLSLTEVNTLVAPLDQDVKTLMEWLDNSGVKLPQIRTTSNRDFVVVTSSVSQCESLLSGHYQEYWHSTGVSAVRMVEEPHLPPAVADIVDFVSPTTQRLPRNMPLHAARKSAKLGSGGFTNTPTSLRKLYAIGEVEGSAAHNRQAVTGFLEQHRTNVDLQHFFSTFYKKGSGRKVSKTVGDGAGEGHVGGQIEAELDTQYIMAIGGNVETQFWTFRGRAPNEPENEPFLKFLTTLANTTDDEVPLVISSSYGEDENSTDLAYAKRCNVEFQKAGARGITLLFSSGGSGVAGTATCGTQCDDGTDCFVPQWPAASPWVTSVGGTKQYPGGPEIADGISSGGFSNRWDRPSWQQAAVAKYLHSSGLPDIRKYHSTGRGFPDVAAQSENFMVILDLIPYPVSGTSCASPTVAGIVSLLNDVRLQKGQASLGFLAPLLYSRLSQALTDVVNGSNPGCDTKGFPALPGWDAVTGLGTPNYAQMAKIVEALPSTKRVISV